MDASDADARPLPSEDTTPPVTKIREVMVGPFVERHILAEGRRAVSVRHAGACASPPRGRKLARVWRPACRRRGTSSRRGGSCILLFGTEAAQRAARGGAVRRRRV